MWLFDRRNKTRSIQPGESRELGLQIPKNAERILIHLEYDDAFKNKYVTLDLKIGKI